MATGAEEVLSYTEIYSWSKLHGIQLTVFEIETLRQIDLAYRSS